MITADKVQWYVNRLRSMPKQEVLHRVKEAIEARRPFIPDSSTDSSSLIPADAQAPRLVDVWRTYWSSDVAAECLRQADAVSRGSISVFGHPWSSVDKLWRIDPVTGYEWPAIAARKIDYRHSDSPDPKWTWEVNRLLFLIPVAFAIESDTYDRQIGEEMISTILTDWIANCKPGEGPMWAASIEVAIRSISMTLALQAIKSPNKYLTMSVGRSVRDHAAWIKRFPSAYSSANNHRIAEISALLILDSSWAGILSAAERVRLERELYAVSRALFSRDGLGLEQSPTYAGFSLEFLGLVLHTYKWTDGRYRDDVKTIVDSASAALLQFTNEDGSLLRYGDDDEGKVVSIVVPDHEYARSLSRLGGGNPPARQHGLLSYAEGGVSLLRHWDAHFETTWLIDHGPLGFGEIAAHGHADTLSVAMRSDGIDWIVDAGTYRYHGSKEWRTYFRSSRAHNAPVLDGSDSSVMTGDFNWDPEKRAYGQLMSSYSNGSVAAVRASHDGYLRQGRGLVWRTLERVEAGRYRISDEHESDSQLSTAFLINPECNVVETEAGWHITHPRSSLTINLTVSACKSKIFERPDQKTSWFSPKFGTKLPTWRLGAEAGTGHKDPLSFEFVISDTHQQEIKL